MSTSHAEPVVTDDEVARLFHEAYERLAPSFGYETRKASAVPWLDVPDNNRRLMTAVVGEVRAALEAAEPIPDEPEIAAIRERADLPDAAVPRVMEDPEADGSLDDLAITGGIDAFHIERMDTGHWWLAVYLNDGTRYSFNLHSKRRIDARYDLEEVGRVRAAATPEADLRGVGLDVERLAEIIHDATPVEQDGGVPDVCNRYPEHEAVAAAILRELEQRTTPEPER